MSWRTLHRWENQYAVPKALLAREVVAFAGTSAPDLAPTTWT